MSFITALALAVAVIPGRASAPPEATTTSQTQLGRIGHHHFKIATHSKEAQRRFDRGLTLAYAFSHYAAEQEFRRTVVADPNCAMAWWGIALVNGPHINFPIVPPDKAAAAWEALAKARALTSRSTPLEQDLINALAARYASPQPEDRSSLDTAYAAAMRDVWRIHIDNADAATLFAEAAMDLHPWDLWNADGPQPWTPEILTALECALRTDPKHPGANHLYIHAVEASAHPERGVAAADRLRALVPGAGHLVHMPSHIYMRVGRYDEATEANVRAVAVDREYIAKAKPDGMYPMMYYPHN